MGYYDFSAPAQGSYPDLRVDLGAVLSSLRAVESLAGLEWTVWHPGFGGGIGTQNHPIPHQAVLIGGETPGYLRDAIDRARNAMGAPVFDWSGTGIPSSQGEWSSEDAKGALSLNDVLFLKQAIGRVVSPTAIASYVGTLTHEGYSFGTGSGFGQAGINAEWDEASFYFRSASNQGSGSCAINEDGSTAIQEPTYSIALNTSVFRSYVPESIESSGAAYLAKQAVFDVPLTKTQDVTQQRETYQNNSEPEQEFEELDLSDLAVALVSSDDEPTDESALNAGTVGTSGRFVWALIGGSIQTALDDVLGMMDAEHFDSEWPNGILDAQTNVQCPTSPDSNWAVGLEKSTVYARGYEFDFTSYIYWLQPYTPPGWPWSLMP